MPKKEKKEDFSKPDVRLKYEIAEELGLSEKVRTTGWKSLTSKESGRIGGIMTKIKKEKLKLEKEANNKDNIL